MLARDAKMKVCRHPYDAARTVIQFLQSVVQLIDVNADTNQLTNLTHQLQFSKSSNERLTVANQKILSAKTLYHIRAFLDETTGSPTSLAHVGPVTYDAVMAINKHITDCVLGDIITHSVCG